MPASSQRSLRKRSAAKSAVLVVSGSARYRPLERTVRRALQEGLSALKKKGSVEAYLVADRTMRRLNRAYRRRDAPANVLAFPWPKRFPAAPRGRTSLGEIYLGPDTIRREKGDLAALAVHGLLHLAGYGHGSNKEWLRMERAAFQILKNNRY